jgi:hypothetical protein
VESGPIERLAPSASEGPGDVRVTPSDAVLLIDDNFGEALQLPADMVV